ncbi:MAG: chaperone NapD [Desulfovibrio sp.]|jgi:nitrate reductase NapAB chaperone NapD|nr:chaperone NapD [Desulfovibrio sp.]
MAVVGFLVHTGGGRTQSALAALDAMPELTTYGIHKDNVIVAVAEVASVKLDALLSVIKKIEGVIDVSLTSMNVEDEDPGAALSSEILDRP